MSNVIHRLAALGVALMLAMPVTAAWAQPAEALRELPLEQQDACLAAEGARLIELGANLPLLLFLLGEACLFAPRILWHCRAGIIA